MLLMLLSTSVANLHISVVPQLMYSAVKNNFPQATIKKKSTTCKMSSHIEKQEFSHNAMCH